MARVVPSPAARLDLVTINDYSIEQFGQETGETHMLGFDEAFDLLAAYPSAGQRRPELGDAIRCLVHRKHRIFYRFDGEIVLVIRIIHHAMDARRALQ